MKRALNQMTTPHLSFAAFLDLARALGCVGVEARNDMDALGRPLFDGMDPAEAGQMIRDRDLRLVGLSQVYPFNAWDAARKEEVAALIATAKAAGAETIGLIPRNDGTGAGNGERQANLRIALKDIYPMLVAADMAALVEPLGFGRSSLRSKQELVDTIVALGIADRVKLVHDTFHHALAGGGDLYPAHTGIVHVSAVIDPSRPLMRCKTRTAFWWGRTIALARSSRSPHCGARAMTGRCPMNAFRPRHRPCAIRCTTSARPLPTLRRKSRRLFKP